VNNNNYRIKVATREEIDIAVDWAAQEGWNPGLNDSHCYYSADSSGFLIGFLGEQAIATISVVKYGRSFGFLGFYIVHPEYRAKGYGIQIWQAGLKHLEGRNIGLDGVVEQQQNYQKSGFNLAYRNIRYEGKSTGAIPSNTDIVELSSLPFSSINSYDALFFPEQRSEFIQAWIRQPQSSALGIMQNGKLAGYGVIRACHSGHKIGPLFADSPELADTLFQALRSTVSASQSIYLDIPEVNSDALSLVNRYDMKVVFETARMYSKENPILPLGHVYGVTSFELG